MSIKFWNEIVLIGGTIPERSAESMKNFYKQKLNNGILVFYKNHVNDYKYSHAFPTVLEVKPAAQAPALTTNEKNYLSTATWSEYAFENYNSN